MNIVRVVDLNTTPNLVDVCLQETGGLGVKCIIDSGGENPAHTCSVTYSFSPSPPLPLSPSPAHLPSLSLPLPLFLIHIQVAPNYSLSNFLIESAPLRKQLEQETCRYQYELSSSSPTPYLPTKFQIVSCLAARGHWVTSQPDLQLDPPEAQQLFMKGASLHFLFEPVWTLSSAHQGNYLHILSSVMAKLEAGVIK